jgi:uncharacterized membrane protein
MMAKGFWLLLVLSVLSLIGSLLLERTLAQHYVLVLMLLVVAAVVTLFSMLAVGVGSRWGWPLATLCFAGLTILSLVMYLASRANTAVFVVTLLVSLAGVIAGVAYVGSDDMDALKDLPKVRFEKPKARRTTRRASRRGRRTSRKKR